ncbi:hypothetical protein BJY04DRAFT_227656 [Aspergillus karnatakaensis]|uniref:cupin domain-containing protein n=1 Tax=Aspergillus karnatakaensis TaxID=1810916 RepID=UPI003CCCDC2F
MGIEPGTPTRRVVTTHSGLKSSVLIDDQRPLLAGFASNARTVWQHHQYPAELASHDASEGNIQIYTGGSLIRVVDFEPKSEGHHHRTLSLDYGIVLQGELELVLEDGSRSIVQAGDIVVQQATMHQWNNLTDHPCRIVFVLMPSEPPAADGQVLDDYGFPEQYKPDFRQK